MLSTFAASLEDGRRVVVGERTHRAPKHSRRWRCAQGRRIKTGSRRRREKACLATECRRVGICRTGKDRRMISTKRCSVVSGRIRAKCATGRPSKAQCWWAGTWETLIWRSRSHRSSGPCESVHLVSKGRGSDRRGHGGGWPWDRWQSLSEQVGIGAVSLSGNSNQIH